MHQLTNTQHHHPNTTISSETKHVNIVNFEGVSFPRDGSFPSFLPHQTKPNHNETKTKTKKNQTKNRSDIHIFRIYGRRKHESIFRYSFKNSNVEKFIFSKKIIRGFSYWTEIEVMKGEKEREKEKRRERKEKEERKERREEREERRGEGKS